MVIRRYIKLLLVVLMIMVGFSTTIEAALPTQQIVVLGAETPTTGTLNGTVTQVSYAFECFEGGVNSVYVETTSGDLTVNITVLDAKNQLLVQGGKERKNPNVSVAEAFTIPSSGQCTVELSQVANTAGDYALRVLPGYASLNVWDTFDGTQNPLRLTWDTYESEDLITLVVDEQARIRVMQESFLGDFMPQEFLSWTDLYIQADFIIEGVPSYYEYGFVLRLDEKKKDFYSFAFSSDSDWSLAYVDEDWNWIAIQNWTVSPLIDGADKTPRVGVLVQGDTYKIYFNDRLVGEVTDPNQSASQGTIALTAATGAEQNDWVTVSIDNLIITQPFSSNTILSFGDEISTQPTSTPGSLFGMTGTTKTPQAASPPAPTLPSPPTSTPRPTSTPEPSGQTLQNWASYRASEIVSELQEYGFVPAGGRITLTVPESFGDTSSRGFNYYPLGGGRSFRNFVLTFDARLDISGPESGCGMNFRTNSTSSDMVMITEDGAAILAQWDENGDMHRNSFIDLHNAIKPGVGATNRVTVVAFRELVKLYVNGELVTDSRFTEETGTIALEMFVATDDLDRTQRTYCQLENIWLWEF